jgi:hypothetical protein
MLVAKHTWVTGYDGQRIAIHKGVTRVSDDHPLAKRFPLRFQKVDWRQDARSRFRHVLDRAQTYSEYRGLLDEMTARLQLVEQRDEVRVNGF